MAKPVPGVIPLTTLFPTLFGQQVIQIPAPVSAFRSWEDAIRLGIILKPDRAQGKPPVKNLKLSGP
jgi:hypothetical protein